MLAYSKRDTQGFHSSANSYATWADEKPYIVISDEKPLRDKKGRVRRWGSKESADKAAARLMQD